jgi:hypothetical protein
MFGSHYLDAQNIKTQRTKNNTKLRGHIEGQVANYCLDRLLRLRIEGAVVTMALLVDSNAGSRGPDGKLIS